jgi:hypothetical protein
MRRYRYCRSQMSGGAVRCAKYAEEGYAGMVGLEVKLPGIHDSVTADGTICNGDVGPGLRHGEEWSCRSWRYISRGGWVL